MAYYVVRIDNRIFFCPTKVQAKEQLSGQSCLYTHCARLWSGFPRVGEGQCKCVKLVEVK